MKPVFQAIVCKGRGDCFSACLASILEFPLEAVPSFNALAIDSGAKYPVVEADDHIHRYVEGLGFTLLRLRFKDVHDYRSLYGQYCLMTVPSQRFEGVHHAVVGQFQWHPDHPGLAIKLMIVHDPNPGNAPYPADLVPSFIKFLVPKNPAPERLMQMWMKAAQ